MKSRAVLENVPDSDRAAATSLDVADLRHPEAVERLLARINRGDELPLVSCCAEDLEAVRRHVTFARTPEVRTMPRARRRQHQEPQVAVSRQEAQEPVSRQRQSAPASAEQEHASMKVLGVLALVILIVAIIWQLGLWGVTAAYTSYAADEAAHTASVGGTTAEARDDALRSVPSWFRTNIDVSQTDLGTVKATSSMPVLTPIFTVDGLDLTSEAPIVSEGS